MDASTGARHHLRITRGGDDVVFACEEPGCGRRLVIDRNTRELTVIVPGNVGALHGGGTDGLRVGLSVTRAG